MLEWMGKKKVVNHHNDVPFHVLERKWTFRKNSDKSEATLTRLSTFASTANFFRGETPRDGAVCRESSRIAFRNAV